MLSQHAVYMSAAQHLFTMVKLALCTSSLVAVPVHSGAAQKTSDVYKGKHCLVKLNHFTAFSSF